MYVLPLPLACDFSITIIVTIIIIIVETLIFLVKNMFVVFLLKLK